MQPPYGSFRVLIDQMRRRPIGCDSRSKFGRKLATTSLNHQRHTHQRCAVHVRPGFLSLQYLREIARQPENWMERWQKLSPVAQSQFIVFQSDHRRLTVVPALTPSPQLAHLSYRARSAVQRSVGTAFLVLARAALPRQSRDHEGPDTGIQS
jgi:hypothetical protein